MAAACTPYLFLDVDGVLHHNEAATPPEWFNPRCMNNLKKIVAATGCKVVLSSFWRTDAEQILRLNAALAGYGILPVERFTRQHAPPDLSLPESERHSLSVIRAREISEWRMEGARREMAFAVLDDLRMSAELPCNKGHPACYELEDHLVNTCPRHGVTDAHAAAAIAMLSEDSHALDSSEVNSVVDATRLRCALCDAEGCRTLSTGMVALDAHSLESSAASADALCPSAPQSTQPKALPAAVPPPMPKALPAVAASTAVRSRGGAPCVREGNSCGGAAHFLPQLRITAASSQSVRATIGLSRSLTSAAARDGAGSGDAHTSVPASDAWREGAYVASECEPRMVSRTCL